MQEQIQSVLDHLVAEGNERGVQLAVYKDGKLAVDCWAGVANAADGTPVNGETLFPIFSTGKGVAATVVHLLVERGLISYETRIEEVWPEFGASGKAEITLRQALNHSAGIPHMPRGIGFEEMCDWDTMCARIAGLTPLWEPGTKVEYHAMTYGWIVGEVARRVDGRSFAQLMEEEIKGPLGMEGIYMGIPDAVESRVAILEHPGCGVPEVKTEGPEAVPSWMGPLYDIMNRADVRRACIPASSGIGNARSIARHYAALLPGGVDGVSLLPERRIRLATERQKPEPTASDSPRRWALGYQICAGYPLVSSRMSAFGHDGFGGSMGFADPEVGLAVGFVRNLYGMEDKRGEIFGVVREVLGL
jgi:CubicO group peptidase (beta-lactamase class C family)